MNRFKGELTDVTNLEIHVGVCNDQLTGAIRVPRQILRRSLVGPSRVLNEGNCLGMRRLNGRFLNSATEDKCSVH